MLWLQMIQVWKAFNERARRKVDNVGAVGGLQG